MISWFKRLFYAVQNFERIESEAKASQQCCSWLKGRVDDAVKTIKDRTELHVDVSPTCKGDPHQIVLIGRYRNRDYVQTFSVHPEDFRGLVERCIEMQRYAHRGRIDAVPEMRAIINEESMKWWNE